MSVVVPSYNYGRFVGTAIRSIWTQDYPNIEIIAVDDGSTDDTGSVLRELASESPVPMTVLDGGHRGVCAAMNLGLAEARGEYVSILHADDAYRPSKIRRQVETFTADGGLALVHCEYSAIDEHGQDLEGLTSALDPPPASGDALGCLLWLRCDVRSMTMMYPAEVMRSVGGYDESLPLEDWQSILRLAAYGPVAHVDEPLVLRRVHGHNYSMDLNRKAVFDGGEIAEPVLLEVAPAGTDLDRLRARHIASVITNAVAEGNRGKARAALRSGWRSYPVGRRRLALAYVSGVKSRVWMTKMVPALPRGIVLRLRRLKGGLRSRLRW